MANLVYKALDAQGRFVTGQLQAPSPDAALQQLIELGYVPLDATIAANDKRRGWSSLLPQPTVPKREVTALLQDLALLLRSGLPLDEALSLLVYDARGTTAGLISQLHASISSGANFADALRSHPATALPDLIAIVRSAEATGNLESALETIAQERVKQEKVNARIRNAVRYPIFLLLVSVAVLLFFLLFVVPQFAGVVRDLGTRPDALVRTIIVISEGLQQNGGVIGAIGAAVLSALVMGARMSAVRKRLVAPLGRLPIVSGIVALQRTTLLCRGLGMLLANGVNLTDALRLMSETGVGGDQLTTALDLVRRGDRLVDALVNANLVPPLAARMLRVGEESGALALVCTRCGDYYESKLTEQIDRLTGIVGPAAIIFIASVIGTLIVSIMSTLLSIDQMVM